MGELALLLQSRRAEGAVLVPVLCGLTPEQLLGMRALYDAEPWGGAERRPAAEVLDKWAADLGRLPGCATEIQSASQGRDNSELVCSIVESSLEHLAAQGKLPAGLEAGRVHSTVPLPPALQLFGRQEEERVALEALRGGQRCVELRGGPGEGKSALACRLAEELCSEWARELESQPGTLVAHAHVIDLRGLQEEGGFKDTVAAQLLSKVAGTPQPPSWATLQGWLSVQAPAPLLVVFKNAEGSIQLQAFKEVVDGLQAMPRVHLIVATRTEAPAAQRVEWCPVVQLSRLDSEAGLQLLASRLGSKRHWAASDQEAARELVELVHGNPLVLSVAAGLIDAKDFVWQDALHGAQKVSAAGDLTPPEGDCLLSLRTTILQQWLYQCLQPVEQQFLASLCVFPSSFSAQGAAAVNAGMEGHTVRELLQLLEATSLIERSEVASVSDVDEGGGRFFVPALVRHAAKGDDTVAATDGHITSSINSTSNSSTSTGTSTNATTTTTTTTTCSNSFTHWMLQHPAGPGQVLLRCSPHGPAPDPALCQATLHRERPNLAAAAGMLQGVLVAAGDHESSHPLASAAMLVAQTMTDAVGQVPLGAALHRAVLGARETLLGHEHRATLLSKRYVANAWYLQGEFLKAKEVQEEALSASMRALGPEHADTIATVSYLASMVYVMGDVPAACELQEREVGARTRVQGPEHPDTMVAKSLWADMLTCVGQLARAKEVHEELLAARTSVLGPDHLDTIATMRSLVSCWCLAGDVPAACEAQEQVVGARARVLGAEHPDTTAAKLLLADMLAHLGRLAEAKELQEAVVAARTTLLGPDHSDTAAAMSKLAGTLHRLGDLPGARELHEQVVGVLARVQGPEHPDTMAATALFADALAAQGQLARAKAVQQELLAARTRVLGPDHLDTIATTSCLASTLHGMGDLQRARELREDVVRARAAVQGPEHVETVSAKSYLAATLYDLDQLPEAQALQEQVLAANAALLGPEHVYTIRAKGCLAVTMMAQGRYSKAMDLQEEALAAATSALGAGHLDTLRAKGNLAVTLQELGQLRRAARLQEQVLAARAALQGPEHADTTSDKAHLAATLLELGQVARARGLQEEVLAATVARLGPDHPDSTNAQADLAATLHHLGHLLRAKELQEGVVAARARQLGRAHPDTLLAQANFAATLHAAGELERARGLQEDVLAAMEKALGPDHPDVAWVRSSLEYTVQVLDQLPWGEYLGQHVVAERARSLATEALRSAEAAASLAAAQQELGRLKELQEGVLAAAAPVLGADHPGTRSARASLATTMRNLDVLLRAQDLRVPTCS